LWGRPPPRSHHQASSFIGIWCQSLHNTPNNPWGPTSKEVSCWGANCPVARLSVPPPHLNKWDFRPGSANFSIPNNFKAKWG
jgi:hypothetical protein